MTVIVGLVDGGTVWMGADGLGSSTCGAYPRASECLKLFRRGEMLIAVSGELRVAQVVEHVMAIPEHDDGTSPMAYMVGRFVPALRAALIDGGWKVEFELGAPGWSILIGYRAVLYGIYSTLQIDVTSRPYIALGCGMDVAHGSLHTTQGLGWAPAQRIMLALQAAAEHDVHVAEPFTVAATEPWPPSTP